MAMDKPRDRKGIKREITDRGKDMAKRLKDAQKVVKDKNVTKETAKALRLSGTSEGTTEVRKAVQSAAEATDKEHKKQMDDLQKQVIDSGKKTEQELKQRVESTKQDVKRLQQGLGKIDTKGARAGAQAAEKGAEKDVQFLSDSQRTQERDRVKGEKDRDKQKQEVKNAKISFRN